jgi:hypothetical protein
MGSELGPGIARRAQETCRTATQCQVALSLVFANLSRVSARNASTHEKISMTFLRLCRSGASRKPCSLPSEIRFRKAREPTKQTGRSHYMV